MPYLIAALEIAAKSAALSFEVPPFYVVGALLNGASITYIREIHPLIRNPIGTAMLIPGVCAPRVMRCRLGKYWWRDFFRKRLRVVDSELAIQSLISFRCRYLGQIGCQVDGLSRQPNLGVTHVSMTHREAAIFDDACTVPTPCLLLPAYIYRCDINWGWGPFLSL